MTDQSIDVFHELNVAELADCPMEEAQNVMRWVRGLGDAGTWFAGDFCLEYAKHPERVFDRSDTRHPGAKRKEIIAHLADGYGCCSKSIYNWMAIAERWPDRERRKVARPGVFLQALATDDPDTWVDRAVAGGWSMRELQRQYRTAKGEVHAGPPLKARVRAKRFTDELGLHHIDVQPEPAGLFGFEVDGVFDMGLSEVVSADKATKGGEPGPVDSHSEHGGGLK